MLRIDAARGGAVALTALVVLGVPTCRAQEPAFDGTYSVAYAGGAFTLSLRTLPAGEVRGRMDGPGAATFEVEGRIETDEDGDATVRGSLVGPTGRGDFTLYRDEDGDHGLLVTPYDAAGTPRGDMAAIYAVERVSDARDARLVGVWSTQIVMNSPAGSIATEMRMWFRADGVMVDLGSRALGSIGGGSFDTGGAGPGEQAAWRTDDDVLWISYADSPWTPFARFEISGDRLLLEFPHDGSSQLWSRIPQG